MVSIAGLIPGIQLKATFPDDFKLVSPCTSLSCETPVVYPQQLPFLIRKPAMRPAPSFKSNANLFAARLCATAASALLATGALAHEGHSMSASSHWHITDAWGFVALALAVGAAIWLSKGGK